jgi:two-component system cell cycle sensor histidine kinase/response regulator CckA
MKATSELSPVSSNASRSERSEIGSLDVAPRSCRVPRRPAGTVQDLASLLTTIAASIDLAGSAIGDEHPAGDHLAEVRKTVQRAFTVARQLLSSESEKVRTSSDVDLNRVVSRAERTLQNLIAHEMDVVVRRGSPIGRVRADETEIEAMLVTLAIVVRDAMPHGGCLVVETAMAEADLLDRSSTARFGVLSIGDGKTSDPRSSTTTLLTTQTAPAGLADVCRIVARQGGRVFAVARPGRGVGFQVYLPASAS